MAISYEEFRSILETELISVMGDGYEHYKFKFMKVEKVNRTLDGFSVYEDDDNLECIIAPTLYVEDFYKEYEDCGSIIQTLNEIAKTIKMGIQVASVNAKPFSNLKYARDKVIFQLINTKRNTSLLKELPHRDFMDLSIVYRVVAGFDENCVSSALVNEGMRETLEVTEEELFDLALENTTKMLPFKIKSMDEIIVNMLKRSGNFTEDIYERLEHIPDEKRLFLITNKYAFCAANALLFPEVFEKIADSLESDLYVVPVSVNELMVLKAVPDNSISDILELVRHSNSLDSSMGEILSDNVYFYSSKNRSISIPYELHK